MTKGKMVSWIEGDKLDLGDNIIVIESPTKLHRLLVSSGRLQLDFKSSFWWQKLLPDSCGRQQRPSKKERSLGQYLVLLLKSAHQPQFLVISDALDDMVMGAIVILLDLAHGAKPKGEESYQSQGLKAKLACARRVRFQMNRTPKQRHQDSIESSENEQASKSTRIFKIVNNSSNQKVNQNNLTKVTRKRMNYQNKIKARKT
ncbi:hypothetical protein VNO77_00106 [Canavalia gladiata]|uniref:Uncharacterized protein n=1 Tax=Canavalia gladiata TaxID=3824 RepID=A0AAN9MPG4_CANGL